MSEMNIPEWIDRRTLEWAVGVCEHIGAVAITRSLSPSYRAGAAACGAQFRAALSARPALPAALPAEGEADGGV